MTHPLQDLDGAKRHIFSANGQDFFLRIITSSQKLREHQDILRLTTEDIGVNAQVELQADLDRRGNRGKLLELTDGRPTSRSEVEAKGLDHDSFLIIPAIPEENLENYRKYFAGYFSSKVEHNDTIFAVEDASGKVVCSIWVTINDPEKRQRLKVSEDVDTLLSFDQVITAKEFRGQNIFSNAFDKIMTMMSNPKRNQGKTNTSLQFAIGVATATELDEDGKQFFHLMNLPRYYEMWQNRFENLSLIKRWQVKGGKVVEVGEQLDIAGSYDEKVMSDFIKDQREEAASNGHRVIGADLSGKISSSEFAQEKRKDLMEARGSKGITRNKTSAHKEGWLEKPQVENLMAKSREQDQGRT